jgi:hypothetical protein
MTNTKEYMRKYMLQRYHRRRAHAIEVLGGKCVDCESNDNLEFDHALPEDKSFNVAKAFAGMAEKTLWVEIHKCVLRCKECHAVKTYQEDLAVGHGLGLTGKKNCRCDLCRPLKNAYSRDLKRRRKETSGS